MSDNILDFGVDALKPLRDLSGNDQILSAYFDDNGDLFMYLGEMPFTSMLLMKDTLSRLIDQRVNNE